MFITTAALASVSAIPMASDNPIPTFSNPSHHPMVKSISTSSIIRDNQLFVSPMVEGVILVQNNNLTVVYYPRKTQDLVHDPDGSDPILIGAVGPSLQSATPVSVSTRLLLQDFLCLEDDFPLDNIPVPHSKVFAKSFFNDHPDKHEHALPTLSENDIRCLRLPVALPKLKGTTIIEGSIKDPRVLDSMTAYHPVAATWIRAHIKLSSSTASPVTLEALQRLDASLVPSPTSTIPVSPHHQPHINLLLANDSDPASLRAQVTDLLEEKLSLHKHHHPPVDNNSLAESLSIDHALQTDTSTANKNKEKFVLGSRVLDAKHQRSINIWRLFMAGVADDGNLHLPVFTDPFLDGYSQSTITENTRLTSAAMREHDQRRSSDTRDYLHKLISDSQWNNATTALFLNAVIFDSLLDEIVSYLHASISFLTFLPIPPASVNPSVQTFLHQSNLEHLEAIVGESNEKKRKINLKTFQGGLQENPTHIITGLANFESKLSFMLDYENTPEENQPLIVQWINQLANLYSSRQFTRFYDKHHKNLPWIPHTMVTQVQIIISSLAKIAKSYLHQNTLKRNLPLHASILRSPLKTFNDVIDDIKRSIRGSGLGCFATPPPSYISPDPPPTSRFKPRHIQNDPSSVEKPAHRRGWLQATGPFRWPHNLECGHICNRFAQIDSSCSLGPNCPQHHLVFPHGFNNNDRQIIWDFVHNHKNLSFPPHIKYSPPNQKHNNNPQSQETKITTPSILRNNHSPPATEVNA